MHILTWMAHRIQSIAYSPPQTVHRKQSTAKQQAGNCHPHESEITKRACAVYPSNPQSYWLKRFLSRLPTCLELRVRVLLKWRIFPKSKNVCSILRARFRAWGTAMFARWRQCSLRISSMKCEQAPRSLTMSELAKNLKCRMRELNMTQKELGQRVRLSPSMIWRLLTGKVTETRHIVKLATVLECDPTWLQYGEGLTTSRRGCREAAARYSRQRWGCSPLKKGGNC